MRVSILKKMWDLQFRSPAKDKEAICDAPNVKNKKILVRSRLRGIKLLEYILHETHHAADWYKDEEWIEAVAHDQAKIICKDEVLRRFIDSAEILDKVEDVLRKHGYTKN